MRGSWRGEGNTKGFTGPNFERREGRAKLSFLLYNLIVGMGTLVLSPLLFAVLLLKRKHRQGLIQKLGYWPKGTWEALRSKRPLWFHAVSVGEVMAAVPLVERIRREFPDLPILFTTVTATGHRTALDRIRGVDALLYFPFDYPCIVRRVLRRVSPRAFITTETEIWPNFMRALGKRRIPILLVNGRISPRSYRRYRRFRFLFGRVLREVSLFCMQSPLNAQRIERIGADPSRVQVLGNLKFDQGVPDSRAGEDLRRLFRIEEEREVFVAGSTHRGEEEVLLEVFMELKKDFPRLLLLLAPRAPERFEEVERLIRRYFPASTVRRTLLPGAPGEPWDVILLDTIGELSACYALGSIVYIGGSLVPVGGHNPIEAVVHRKPVLFGPFMYNFPEVSEVLRASGGGIAVADGGELLRKARELLSDPAGRKERGEAGFRAIEPHRGAVERHMKALAPYLRAT